MTYFILFAISAYVEKDCLCKPPLAGLGRPLALRLTPAARSGADRLLCHQWLSSIKSRGREASD